MERAERVVWLSEISIRITSEIINIHINSNRNKSNSQFQYLIPTAQEKLEQVQFEDSKFSNKLLFGTDIVGFRCDKIANIWD